MKTYLAKLKIFLRYSIFENKYQELLQAYIMIE